MSFGYFTSGLRLSLDPTRCTGCGRCVDVCPHAVFRIEKTARTEALCSAGAEALRPAPRAVIVARDRCMECGACARNCATGAIRASAGVGCATAIIHSLFRGGEPGCDCGDEPARAGRGAAPPSGGCD